MGSGSAHFVSGGAVGEGSAISGAGAAAGPASGISISSGGIQTIWPLIDVAMELPSFLCRIRASRTASLAAAATASNCFLASSLEYSLFNWHPLSVSVPRHRLGLSLLLFRHFWRFLPGLLIQIVQDLPTRVRGRAANKFLRPADTAGGLLRPDVVAAASNTCSNRASALWTRPYK